MSTSIRGYRLRSNGLETEPKSPPRRGALEVYRWLWLDGGFGAISLVEACFASESVLEVLGIIFTAR